MLFICGSLNQTTQLHAIARQLPEIDARYAPYYVDPLLDVARGLGWLEGTIAGERLTRRCLGYLRREQLAIDPGGRRGGYDLVVTCSDVVVPKNIRGIPLVAVQEGILDPDSFMWRLVRRFPDNLPRWLAGTAATGLSGAYDRFCVASEGYRDLFVNRGADPERVVVTGIPNFDDCAAFRKNDFPRRNYVLVCTSDTRETFKLDSRSRFLAWARALAAGRPTLIKLHPNESESRARDEIGRHFPEAEVYAHGNTEAMIANCEALITQFSSTVFVGLALHKEVHSYHPIAELERLCPLQNRSAARNIAAVVREVLGGEPSESAEPARAVERAA